MREEANHPPEPWTGRHDGPGAQHHRWHHVVGPWTGAEEPGDAAFVGFRGDEGVRRNQGRQGAADGPRALRGALGSLALPAPARALDAGDVEVTGTHLEEGQEKLGRVVTGLLDDGHFPVVLGGGHEVAFGSYLGLAHSALLRSDARLGVLNLDAHFDLRDERIATSGTPFRQIAACQRERGAGLDYAVLGVSQPSNTAALFDTAAELGVDHLADDECTASNSARVDAFLDDFVARCDVIYLTVDLDVLPAATAPGVSAPAAFGVPLEIIQRACDRVAGSGKLAVCDVAELNPGLDIDSRTARTAARLIHRVLTNRVPLVDSARR